MIQYTFIMKAIRKWMVFALGLVLVCLIVTYKSTIKSSIRYEDEDVIKYKRILLYTKKVKGLLHRNFDATHCKYQCKFSTNNSLYAGADMILFYADDFISYTRADLPSSRSIDQLYALYQMESPVQAYRRKENKLKDFSDMFNLTMGYSTKFDIHTPYRRISEHNMKQAKNITIRLKRQKTVVWYVSNYIEYRINYVKELKKHIRVDIYGDCGRMDPCRGKSKCYKKKVSQYMFYLAFENSLCEDYITEKFWDALKLGVIPVVMGANMENYSKVAPPDSFIHIDDFKSPKALGKYLKYLMKNVTALHKYHQWRQSYVIKGVDRLCRACETVHKLHGISTKTYTDIIEYWNKDKFCTDPKEHNILKHFVAAHKNSTNMKDMFCYNLKGNRRGRHDKWIDNGVNAFSFVAKNPEVDYIL